MFNAKALQLCARLHVVMAKTTLPSDCEHVVMSETLLHCGLCVLFYNCIICLVLCPLFRPCLILHIDDTCVDGVCGQQTAVLGCR